MSLLGRLFGGLKPRGGRSGDGAFYYYVRCGRCGEKVRVRVDRGNDLAQDFEDGGDYPSGYTATKGVVGNKCFRTMSLTITYDRHARETGRTIEGGEFITAEDYAAGS